MKELGENTIQFHREVGAFLAEKPVDILVVYGELAQAIAEGAKKVKPDLHVVSFEEDEKEDMLDWLDAQIGEGDAVLFKGSNSMKLGRRQRGLSQSRRLPPLQVMSNSKFVSVGVHSPTEINAP